MTCTDRLSAALTILRWGPSDVAAQCHVNERTVRRWLSGQNDPPEWLVIWVEARATDLLANPPPLK